MHRVVEEGQLDLVEEEQLSLGEMVDLVAYRGD